MRWATWFPTASGYLQFFSVIPAQAGIQRFYSTCLWVCPCYAREFIISLDSRLRGNDEFEFAGSLMAYMENTLITQLADLVLGIDHVAIAVKDIDASIAWYSSALGFSLKERSEISGNHSGMLYAVLTSGSATVVLVQGTSPASQVARFLAEFGAGMHHIALAVSDLDAAIDRISSAGGGTDTPIVCDNGIRQAFLQRDPATGMRIELIERDGGEFSRQNVERLFKVFEEKDLY